MSATWSIAVGIIVYIVAIIFATIYYLSYRKLSLVTFIASIATYIFAVFYTWDVFEPSKHWILIILVISTALMAYLAKYFSKYDLEPSKVHTSLKEKKR